MEIIIASWIGRMMAADVYVWLGECGEVENLYGRVAHEACGVEGDWGHVLSVGKLGVETARVLGNTQMEAFGLELVGTARLGIGMDYGNAGEQFGRARTYLRIGGKRFERWAAMMAMGEAYARERAGQHAAAIAAWIVAGKEWQARSALKLEILPSDEGMATCRFVVR